MDTVNRQTFLFNMDNGRMSTFGERLKEARKDAKISQGKLASLIGVKQPTIADLEAHGKGSTKVSLMARVLGVNALWLSEGKGKKQASEDMNALATFIESNHQPINEESIEVPLLNAYGSMGEGSEVMDADIVIDVLRLSKNWILKTLKNITGFSSLRFVHGLGDSMAPTFNDGDILLVDIDINSADVDGVYVLKAHDRLFIKRVRQRLDGQFEISSDNPSVKTVDVLNGEHEIEVKGRVVWAWNGKRL